MLFQHHQMFSLQPSPMPPTSPVINTRRGRRRSFHSPSRHGGSSSLSTTPSSSLYHSRHPYFDAGFMNDSATYNHHHNNNESRSRSPSHDRNGYGYGRNNNNHFINHHHHHSDDASSSNLINAPSTPRRSTSSSSSLPKSFDPYTFSAVPSSSSTFSSPTKLGPPLYLTPKLPSYDDAPFDPTSTPSRGLKFPAPGPVTPTSMSRGGALSGRYGYSYGYGYGGYGSASGSTGAGGGGPGGGLAPPPPIWGTPQTPTNAVGGSARGGSGDSVTGLWSGWGDESPVRRKKPDATVTSFASSSSTAAAAGDTTTTPFASNHSRGSALLDSPFVIGPSSSAESRSGLGTKRSAENWASASSTAVTGSTTRDLISISKSDLNLTSSE